MIPIANFGFSRTGLDVTFSNLSFNTDNTTTYNWDFGDGSTSTDKIPPTHSFGSEGFFLVKLTVTNGADIDSIEMSVGVSNSLTTLLSLPIFKLVSYYLPTTLTTASQQEIFTAIQTWQIYIQPLVDEPLIPISVNDVHNEFKWPSLLNVLIAQLVAYDLLVQESAAFLINLASSGNISSSNTRSIKTMETGPTRVEWFDDGETLNEISSAYSKATSPTGIIFLLKQSICQMSSRNRIYLPICGQLKHNPTPFQISESPQLFSPYSSSLGNLIEETIYVWSGNFTW